MSRTAFLNVGGTAPQGAFESLRGALSVKGAAGGAVGGRTHSYAITIEQKLIFGKPIIFLGHR